MFIETEDKFLVKLSTNASWARFDKKQKTTFFEHSLLVFPMEPIMERSQATNESQDSLESITFCLAGLKYLSKQIIRSLNFWAQNYFSH